MEKICELRLYLSFSLTFTQTISNIFAVIFILVTKWKDFVSSFIHLFLLLDIKFEEKKLRIGP